MIQKEDADVTIKELSIGSDSNRIMIILARTDNPYNIMVWDIKMNLEIEVTNAEDPFEVLWDHKGDCYVV